jgi:hypothetical protein
MESATLADVLRISEQLSPADQLRLIGLLSDRLRSELDANQEPIDMLLLAGVGAELWQEIDVDAYLDQERASWQS